MCVKKKLLYIFREMEYEVLLENLVMYKCLGFIVYLWNIFVRYLYILSLYMFSDFYWVSDN